MPHAGKLAKLEVLERVAEIGQALWLQCECLTCSNVQGFKPRESRRQFAKFMQIVQGEVPQGQLGNPLGQPLELIAVEEREALQLGQRLHFSWKRFELQRKEGEGEEEGEGESNTKHLCQLNITLPLSSKLNDCLSLSVLPRSTIYRLTRTLGAKISNFGSKLARA